MNKQGVHHSFNSDDNADLDLTVDASAIAGYLPKEFERKLFDQFDKRFGIILFISFVIHFLPAFYFAVNPPDTTIRQAEIERIQQKFARLILEKEIPEDPVETEQLLVVKEEDQKSRTTRRAGANVSGSGKSIPGSSNVDAGGSQTKESHGSAGKAGGTTQGGQSSQDKISQQVSSQGLLGLLTGSGADNKASGVADILGEKAVGDRDLDAVLGGLEKLKKSGKAAGGAGAGDGSGAYNRSRKGDRTTTGTGIDALIEGIGEAKSKDIGRSGNIVVEDISSIEDERGIKSESRDPNDISEVVNRHNSSIQYCYQRELKQNPDLKGKLVIRFTITPEGKAKDVKVISSTLENANVERCVVSRISRWDDFGPIDPTRGDATFRQVYTFGY